MTALVVAPVVSVFMAVPTVVPSAAQWVAFAIVTIASTFAVRVDSAAAQAADSAKKRGEALTLE
ncbi:hypothetical protein GWI34_35385 [Actinomadura sp. DSM 109109]|nr:hypothetical protein [Actinomadura lepetitiana]